MGRLSGFWFVVGPGREPTPEVTRRQLESRLTFGTEAEGRYELDDRGLRLYDPDNNLVAEFKTLDGSALITGTITNDESGQPRVLIDPTKDAYRLINADDSEAGSFERTADTEVALMVRDGGFIAFGSTTNRMRYYNSGFLEFREISAPATPDANTIRLYPKDKAGTSALYFKNDAGTEYELGPVGTHNHDAAYSTLDHDARHHHGGADALSLDNLATGAQTAIVATAETEANTAYDDMATAGPAVTVTPGPSGIVAVSIYCRIRSTAGTGAFMSFAASSGNTVAAADNQAIYHEPNQLLRIGATFLLTGLAAASTVFTAKYKAASGATGEFADRRITVIPL